MLFNNNHHDTTFHQIIITPPVTLPIAYRRDTAGARIGVKLISQKNTKFNCIMPIRFSRFLFQLANIDTFRLHPRDGKWTDMLHVLCASVRRTGQACYTHEIKYDIWRHIQLLDFVEGVFQHHLVCLHPRIKPLSVTIQLLSRTNITVWFSTNVKLEHVANFFRTRKTEGSILIKSDLWILQESKNRFCYNDFNYSSFESLFDIVKTC